LSGDRQACLGEWGEIDTTQSCPAARRIWEVNPAYFDKVRPGAIQLIVLRTPQGPYHGESAERFKARQANALTRTPTGRFPAAALSSLRGRPGRQHHLALETVAVVKF